MRRAAVVLAVVAGVLSAAPAALAKTETASSGDVAATLTYTIGKYHQGQDVRLSIARAGVTVLDQAALADGCKACTDALPLQGFGGSDVSSVTVKALAPGAEPVVIVDLFTGGAHCCTVSVLYRFDAVAGSYARLVHFWGDPGYQLKDLRRNGTLEFVTDDDRFAYRFCAYVCSLRPVKIMRFDGTRLVDATKQFPDLIAADARRLYALYLKVRKSKGQGFGIKGILPAYCADVIAMGKPGRCTSVLNTALKRGELKHQPFDVAAGQSYISQVRGFLKRSGYG